MGVELRRSAAGFSLIEAVIGALILLIVALGIIPLFTQAMGSNVAGAEATSMSNMAATRAEELYQYPFDSPFLTVPGGKTELDTPEVWTEEDGRWIAGTIADAEGAGKTPLWQRDTRIRQFAVLDLLDTSGTPTPLDGNAPPGSVQIKEIQVTLTTARQAGGILHKPEDLVVRLYKSQ